MGFFNSAINSNDVFLSLVFSTNRELLFDITVSGLSFVDSVGPRYTLGKVSDLFALILR